MAKQYDDAQSRRPAEKWPVVSRAEDPRYAVQRRMAEADFRTEAVQARVFGFQRLLRDRKRGLATRRRDMAELLRHGGAEAFVAGLQQALTRSVHPEALPGPGAVRYRPAVAELGIEYELPQRDVVPAESAYRYVPAAGAVQAEPRSESEIDRLYEALVARVALRTLADAFDLAPPEAVDRIAFDGYAAAVDRRTGRPVRRQLVRIRAGRAGFDALRLEEGDLDPVEFLRRRLRGLVAAGS